MLMLPLPLNSSLCPLAFISTLAPYEHACKHVISVTLFELPFACFARPRWLILLQSWHVVSLKMDIGKNEKATL
jgi:hypothetical protein